MREASRDIGDRAGVPRQALIHVSEPRQLSLGAERNARWTRAPVEGERHMPARQA